MASTATVFMWTVEIKRKRIQLWYLVKAHQRGKIKTEQDRRSWVKEKLKAWGEKAGVDGLEGLTDVQLKNKIDTLGKKGKSFVREYVVPHLKTLREEKPSSRYKPTGSASEDTDTSGRDMHEDIDWPALEKASRWPNLKFIFECFDDHPTWGNREGDTVVETGSTDDEASKHMDDEVVSKQTSAVTTIRAAITGAVDTTATCPVRLRFGTRGTDDE